MGGAYKPVALEDDPDKDDGGAAAAGNGTELASVSPAGGKPLKQGSVGASEAARLLAKEVDEESKFAYGPLCLLARTWIACMLLSMLKGGHGAPSLLGVTCGTPGYWGVVGLNLPVLSLLTWLAGRALVKRHEARLACGYQYAEGDVQWDDHKVWAYSGYVAVGAVAAGMLGVGGGMILGPIFNELDFLPQVIACFIN